MLWRAVILAAALLGASIAWSDESAPPDAWTTVKVRGFDEARIAPTMTISGFDSVFVQAPELTFDPQWQRDVRLALGERDRQRLREDYTQLVREALASELAQALDLPQVTSATAHSLVVRPSLTDFRLNAPDLMSDPIKVSFVDYVGAARLTVDLFAGADGAHLGHFSDHSRTRSFGGMDDLKQTNRLVNRRDFRFLAERWGERLGHYLAGQRS